MDALMTVMDDGISEQEEQAPSASSTEQEVPAAVLEATAELSEEESSDTAEDATRYSSLTACGMHGWASQIMPVIVSGPNCTSALLSAAAQQAFFGGLFGSPWPARQYLGSTIIHSY
jgi:hypothetical protein